MGVYYETIPDSLKPWIHKQQMLLVGTAPLSGDGHINISPKGGTDFFGVLSPTQFWYMDLSGSGIETHAHLHEEGNGRICVMFMAFEGPPQIVRIWGEGRPIENGTPEYSRFVEEHNVKTIPGSRSIILIDVHQCATSCGFSVPYYDFVGHRPILNDFFEKKDAKFRAGDEKESMDRYWAWKSARSVDGMPGMKRGVEFAEQNAVAPLKKWKGVYAPGGPKAWGVRQVQEHTDKGLVFLVLLLGIVIGGALSLSVVTPERLEVLQGKEKLW
ncbi:hypothetical protein BU25DRAFT_176485 [Macroventuria anomochaeta]|uniref:Uncharacterized protein n=1 Tax=Macroventuria anomochaeta TaxID=301207 RepID=A0ACB6RQ64_9PLEO|nr:uncharacterized protein BU25DRAFT_176485 [Macroventuria anomochaeta]KAF2623545.1 hypothetical protein BU25DRAFT_176485 [Macroventuria anomochaeta]